MKRIVKQAFSFLLSVLFLLQIAPLSVLAETLQEREERLALLQSTLSDYLYSVIDKDTVATILSPEPYVSETNPFTTRLTVETLSGDTVYYDFSEDIGCFDENGNYNFLDISETEGSEIDFSTQAGPLTEPAKYLPTILHQTSLTPQVQITTAPVAVLDDEILQIFSFDETLNGSLYYKLGSSGNWIEYEAPVRLLSNQSIPVYTRFVTDNNSIINGNTVTQLPTYGIYTSQKNDVGNGDFMLPSGFIRTYNANRGTWFFAFNSSVSETATGNILTLTDFDGTTVSYVLNSELGKYVSIDGEVIEKQSGSVTVDSTTATICYSRPYGCGTVLYGSTGKLAAYLDDEQIVVFDWTDSLLTISDNHNRNYTVQFVNGLPTAITDCINEVTTYGYTNDRLTSVNNEMKCQYDAGGRLIANDGESVCYLTDGRVSKITQPNGKFVKYSYNDAYVNETTPGSVTISDSRGVSLTVPVAEGFIVGDVADETDKFAVYEPESIDPSIDSSTVSLLCYPVELVDQVEPEDETPPLMEQIDDDLFVYYEYDANGLLSAEYITDSDEYETAAEAAAVATEKTISQYADGKLTNQIEFTRAGTTWDFVSRTEIAYNADGEISHRIERVYENGDWQAQTQEGYRYDVYGNITETVKTDMTGSAPRYETTQKTYSALNTVLSDRSFSGTEQTSETVNTYDAAGRLLTQTNNGQTTAFTYTAAGELASYNDGEKAFSLTYTNGNLTGATDGEHPQVLTYDAYGNLVSQSFDIYTLTYNTLGSLVAATVNGNDFVSYTYSGGRQNKTGESYANGQDVTYTYNEDGKITSVSQGENTLYSFIYGEDETIGAYTKVVYPDHSYKILSGEKTEFHVFKNGNVVEPYPDPGFTPISIEDPIEQQNSQIVPNDDGNYSIETVYANETDLDSFDGKVYTFGNIILQRAEQNNSDVFSCNFAQLSKTLSRTYDDQNRLIQKVIPNCSVSYTYNEQNQLTQKSYHHNNHSYSNFVYTYDDAGNILSENDTVYTYDSIGQLIEAENADTKWTYIYDTRGNILTKTEYSVSLVNDERVYTLTKTDAYTYGNPAWPDELTAINGVPVTYDAAGNPTSYRGKTLTWSIGRQLESITSSTGPFSTTTSYTYDDNGIRTAINERFGGTTFALDEDRIISQSDGFSSLYFLYDSTEEVVGFYYDGEFFFYEKNQMKDVLAIMGPMGETVATYTYDPWGKVLSSTGYGTYSLLASINPFRYRSYCYDSDTQWYYLQSRYYDPDTGRFINADQVKFIGLENSVVSNNAFIYANNNPINYTDFTGRTPTYEDNTVDMPPSVLAIVRLLNALLLIYGSTSTIKDYSYPTKGEIIVDFTNQHWNWYILYSALGSELIEYLSDFALESFESTIHRPCLFKKTGVSNEIEAHLKGYLWSKGYEIKCPVIFKLAKYLKSSPDTKKEFVRKACEVTNIRETDVYNKPEQAITFNYFSNIADCYKNTTSDPYYNPKKLIKRSRLYNKGEEWLNLELTPEE